MIGRIAGTWVWTAFGHYRNGILLAPETARNDHGFGDGSRLYSTQCGKGLPGLPSILQQICDAFFPSQQSFEQPLEAALIAGYPFGRNLPQRPVEHLGGKVRTRVSQGSKSSIDLTFS